MALITPNFNPSTALATPGWPLASVPASNPIAGAPGTSPQPNAADAALLYQAEVQSGNTSNRIV